MKIITKQESEPLKELIPLIGCFPLHLGQIGSYLAHKEMSVDKYKSLLTEGSGPPIEISGRYPKTLETALQLNFKSLQPSSLNWLYICSYFNPGEIPFIYLKAWLKSTNPEIDKVSLNLKMQDIKTELRDYALLRFEKKTKTFSMQLDIKKVLQAKADPTALKDAVEILKAIASMIIDMSEVKTMKAFEVYASHISHIYEISKVWDKIKDSETLYFKYG